MPFCSMASPLFAFTIYSTGISSRPYQVATPFRQLFACALHCYQKLPNVKERNFNREAACPACKCISVRAAASFYCISTGGRGLLSHSAALKKFKERKRPLLRTARTKLFAASTISNKFSSFMV